jgi:hypothetical protein
MLDNNIDQCDQSHKVGCHHGQIETSPNQKLSHWQMMGRKTQVRKKECRVGLPSHMQTWKKNIASAKTKAKWMN